MFPVELLLLYVDIADMDIMEYLTKYRYGYKISFNGLINIIDGDNPRTNNFCF